MNSGVVMLLSNPFRPDPRVLKEATALQSAGYPVTIICWDRSAELPQEERHVSGVQVIRIQSVPSSYGLGMRQLTRIPRFWAAVWLLLNQLKPAIVHCHDFDTLPVGLAWGKLHKRPVIYDAHEYFAELCRPRLTGPLGILIYYGIQFMEMLCARLASGVITVDKLLAEIFQKQNRRVIVIGHYPSRHLVNSPAPVFSRQDLHLLYMGRLSRDRGLPVYLSILRCLIQAGVNARLILAGVFTPPNEEASIRLLLADIEDRVEIKGWIPYESIPDLLYQCDIGLVILQPKPRFINALPVKLFEYMAAGLPVIASNFPAISYLVATYDCGLLVEPEAAPEVIADQISRWCQSPSIPVRLGKNGRQAIMHFHNWELLQQKLVLLYQELLADKSNNT